MRRVRACERVSWVRKAVAPEQRCEGRVHGVAGRLRVEVQDLWEDYVGVRAALGASAEVCDCSVVAVFCGGGLERDSALHLRVWRLAMGGRGWEVADE